MSQNKSDDEVAFTDIKTAGEAETAEGADAVDAPEAKKTKVSSEENRIDTSANADTQPIDTTDNHGSEDDSATIEVNIADDAEESAQSSWHFTEALDYFLSQVNSNDNDTTDERAAMVSHKKPGLACCTKRYQFDGAEAEEAAVLHIVGLK